MLNKKPASINEDYLMIKNTLDIDQKYPLDQYFFSLASKYFPKNQTVRKADQICINKENEINSPIKFSDKSLLALINHCQNKNYHVCRENAIQLYYLARKYEIKSLIKETDEYFSNFANDVLIQFLLKIQTSQNLDLDTDISILSNNLSEYINDDLLLLIPIPFMYKIAEKYISNSCSMISDHSIIELFFKYLDKYGRNASILFSLVSFGNTELIYFNRLITDYSKVFDFNFIDLVLLKELVHKEELRKTQQQKSEARICNIFQKELDQKESEIAHLKYMLFAFFLFSTLLTIVFIIGYQFQSTSFHEKLNDINQKIVKQAFVNEQFKNNTSYFEENMNNKKKNRNISDGNDQ